VIYPAHFPSACRDVNPSARSCRLDESGDEWDDFGSDRESVGDEEDGMEEDEK
jgi:hypothetical protein